LTAPTPTEASYFTPAPRARYSEPRQRLEAEITRTRAELQRRAGDEKWRSYATALCHDAEKAMNQGHGEAAWALLLESRRALVHLLDADERKALVVSLKCETHKAGDWRGKAMKELLAANPDGAFLAEAILHLDSALANKMRKRRSRRNELVIAAFTLVGAVVAIVVVLLISPVTTNRLGPESAIFADRALVGLSLLFGVAGACVSTVQRVSKRPWRDVPDERAALMASVVRPASGAASGLVVLAAAQAGLVGQNVSGVLLAAFAGGFTERFILRFLPDDDEKGAKKESETPTGSKPGSPTARSSGDAGGPEEDRPRPE
jgi:hypothetical protein